MMDMTLNRPDIVAEVSAAFERYEQALIDKDVDVLDASFWDSPHTIRYAVRENGYGFDAIHAARVAAIPVPGGSKERRIRVAILTVGTDLATDNYEYIARNTGGRTGRQSQTWLRIPGAGWRVIAAHVSIMPEP